MLRISQANRRLLDAVAAMCGTHSCTIIRNGRDGRYWSLQFRQPFLRGTFLKNLLPYLILKKPQAELMLDFFETTQSPGRLMDTKIWEKKLSMRSEMLRLNQLNTSS